jgi:hypothetical protein
MWRLGCVLFEGVTWDTPSPRDAEAAAEYVEMTDRVIGGPRPSILGPVRFDPSFGHFRRQFWRLPDPHDRLTERFSDSSK